MFLRGCVQLLPVAHEAEAPLGSLLLMSGSVLPVGARGGLGDREAVTRGERASHPLPHAGHAGGAAAHPPRLRGGEQHAAGAGRGPAGGWRGGVGAGECQREPRGGTDKAAGCQRRYRGRWHVGIDGRVGGRGAGWSRVQVNRPGFRVQVNGSRFRVQVSVNIPGFRTQLSLTSAFDKQSNDRWAELKAVGCCASVLWERLRQRLARRRPESSPTAGWSAAAADQDRTSIDPFRPAPRFRLAIRPGRPGRASLCRPRGDVHPAG